MPLRPGERSPARQAAGRMALPVSAAPQAVAIVTGAGSGIGAATCLRLAARGMALVVHTGANREGAEHTASQCAAVPVHIVVGDLAAAATVDALFAAAAGLGELAGVVANAGFADRRGFDEIDAAALARSFDVMVVPFAQLLRAARPLLKARAAAGRRAAVVAVSSFVAHRFTAGSSAFAASAAAKAAVEALVRSAAAELAPHRVGVNAVAPGYVRKDHPGTGALGQAQWDEAAARVPMRRLAAPDDVAGVIAFLLSDDAGYVTGQVIHVDGGLSL